MTCRPKTATLATMTASVSRRAGLPGVSGRDSVWWGGPPSASMLQQLRGGREGGHGSRARASRQSGRPRLRNDPGRLSGML